MRFGGIRNSGFVFPSCLGNGAFRHFPPVELGGNARQDDRRVGWADSHAQISGRTITRASGGRGASRRHPRFPGRIRCRPRRDSPSHGPTCARLASLRDAWGEGAASGGVAPLDPRLRARDPFGISRGDSKEPPPDHRFFRHPSAIHTMRLLKKAGMKNRESLWSLARRGDGR